MEWLNLEGIGDKKNFFPLLKSFRKVTKVKCLIEPAPDRVERIIKGAALQTIEGC
jgi:hypothetical protein